MENNKPNNDELPDSFERLIATTKLERDKFNVRDVEPDEELVNSIKKTGFKFPVTVRKHPEKQGKYLITDGWQRYQSGLKAGYSHVPCNIYSKLEAFREAERSSIQNPWTTYQKIKHNACWFGELLGEGYSRQEAMNYIEENGSITKKTLRKYIRIYNLPEEVHVLLKKIENRKENWNQKSIFKYTTLDDNDGVLRVDIAREIGKAYSEEKISDGEAKSFAIQGLKRNEKSIISEAIKKCSKFPDVDVIEAVEEEARRQKNRNNKGISVGSIILQEEEEKYFRAFRRQSRMSSSKIVKRAVEEKIEKIKENDVLKEEYKPDI
jgi:ParB/RepB/Spo0J family partition protein